MEYLPVVRYEMERLDLALIPLERAIRSIPDDRLNECPVEGARSIAELIDHIYRAVQVSLLGVKLGKCEEADLKGLDTLGQPVSSTDTLLEHAETVRLWIRQVVAELSEAQVTQVVSYFFGWEIRGVDALNAAYTELLHHRGQVQIYLRLMGIQPPSIYDLRQ